jgi:hypothetical protein
MGWASLPAYFLTTSLVFRSTEKPNKHLGFGTVFIVTLARMETRIAIANSIKRNPNLRLAVDARSLELIN